MKIHLCSRLYKIFFIDPLIDNRIFAILFAQKNRS